MATEQDDGEVRPTAADPYASLARYYDLENAAFTEDLPFWRELAAEYGEPILELGCGTGRVLLDLARQGYTVTGIDNSPAMVSRLAAKLKTRSLPQPPATPPWLIAEMTDFAITEAEGQLRPFKLAIAPFNTFMHLLRPQAQIAALNCVRRHLSPRAALVLDLPNPGEIYASQEQGLVLERTFQDGANTVQQFSSVQIDRAAQLAHITWIYDAVAPDGTIRRLTVPLTLRYTFPGEMRLLLERCGFAVTNFCGGYDRRPFADGAPRMIVTAIAI